MLSFYLLMLQETGSERNYPLIFPAVFIPILLIAAASHRRRKRQQVNLAKKAYEEALSNLRSDPLNPELKTQAFEMGTKYASLSRSKTGKSDFDEANLKNDLDAMGSD